MTPAAPKQKKRTFKVWVMLRENGKPYLGSAENTRQRCLDVAHFWYSDAPGPPVRATLTLTKGKGRKK